MVVNGFEPINIWEAIAEAGSDKEALGSALKSWKEFTKAMEDKRPLAIVSGSGTVINLEGRRREELQKQVDTKLATEREDFVSDLQGRLKSNASTIDAYKAVVADLMKDLEKKSQELGQQDEITRNRRTFATLVRQTFSVRIWFISINLDKLIDLLSFIYIPKQSGGGRKETARGR